ncbi:MAG: hypothetical protein NT038_04345 [Euryarchaeota archaeon]|nr:hypothetical protein [Euryarchaeota archaeon]
MDARFLVVGILVILLSIVFASQYATAKVPIQCAVVHPSKADIRFIGSDNSSTDGLRVLRASGNSNTNAIVRLDFGDWSAGMNKTYTAAFAIVNEEPFDVNITRITVSNTSGMNDYMQVWLHGDRDQRAEEDASCVFMYNNGTSYYSKSTTAWTLDTGDGNVSSMSSDGVTVSTSWDGSAHVRYSQSDVNASSGRADFVWVQISINIPEGAVEGDHIGTLEIHFQATTHWNPLPSTLSFGYFIG